MAPPFLFTLLAAFAAALGALLGTALGSRAKNRLPHLLFAASGVLLAVVLCDLLPEAKAALSWPAFLLAGGSGWAAFSVFNRYIFPVCPSCAFSDLDHAQTQKRRQTAAFLLIALALHCLLDGVAVVVGDEINPQTNTGLLFALTVHKIPEGFALVILLLASGWNKPQTLRWAVLIESATVLGGLMGTLLLRDASLPFLSLLLAHVGGGFLFLVTGTLKTLVGSAERGLAANSRLPLVRLCALGFLGTTGLLLLLRFCGA